jgi:hypothetical protein
MSTQLHKILYTDFQDMLVISSIVSLCYYNCCTDGSTSPGNYGCLFVLYHYHHPNFFGWYNKPNCDCHAR